MVFMRLRQIVAPTTFKSVSIRLSPFPVRPYAGCEKLRSHILPFLTGTTGQTGQLANLAKGLLGGEHFLEQIGHPGGRLGANLPLLLGQHFKQPLQCPVGDILV